MGKQHNTFPGEQPEMPAPNEVPEIKQPTDPNEPEIPQEDPGQAPEELPETRILPEKQVLPGEIRD